jgi:cob(I)alamin adenosyltransferase
MKEIKLYTKTGDMGTTGLLTGKRLPKHHIRINAYGTVDELNSWIGLIRGQKINETHHQELIKIQNDLMYIGSELADDSTTQSLMGIDVINKTDVKLLEDWIDQMTDGLPVLKNFVITGGHLTISNTHLARCVCRRAERIITELNESTTINPDIITYINRLSDYLFTLSRKFSHDLKVHEIKWIPRLRKDNKHSV